MRRGWSAAFCAAWLTGCTAGGPASPTAVPSTPTPTVSVSPRVRLPRPTGLFPYYSATAKARSVAVRATPGGRVVRTLANPLPSGAPLTFLLKGPRRPDWLLVYLPVRPNGSTGWVRAADVGLRGVPYRVDVLRGAHRLRLYDRGRLLREFPIGIGRRSTPTPGGVFYLKELLVPTGDGGFYGPYAYGLSGFSTVLASFAGEDAVIGLHGTNDPSSVGRDASHGCIRMRNADITYLAHLLPLGTPVRILA